MTTRSDSSLFLNVKQFVFFVLGLWLLIHPKHLLSEPLVPYSKIDPILKETWEETYPVSFTKVKRKDVLGKGILVLRAKNGLNYLYTFVVSFPRYSVQEGVLGSDESKSKEIIVKLYYDPKGLEKKYWIDLGELTEKYDKRNIVRYINE